MEKDYSLYQFRQKDFIPEAVLSYPVYLIGAGGIGSPTALILEKMGFTSISVFDDDTVDPQNVGSQLYFPGQVDMQKVVALGYFAPSILPIPQTFPPKGMVLEPLSIIISGVDSMTARKEIWEFIKTQRLVKYYIDARMSLEDIRVYALDPHNEAQVKFYEANLYPDSEGEGLPCSAKSVAYNGFFAASVIGGLCSQIIRGIKPPLEIMGDMSTFNLRSTL